MKILKSYVLILLLSACVDEIDLRIAPGPDKLVMFGWVTNEIRSCEVKIYWTNEFSSTSPYIAASGAEVFVVDGKNVRYDFIEKANTGSYWSDSSQFMAVPLKSYQLYVNLNGQSYASTVETMNSLPIVKRAFVNFVADPNEFEIDPNDDNYYVSALINDDPDKKNFYRWKIFVDGQLRNIPEELILFNDQFNNGNTFRYDAGNVLFNQSEVPTLIHMSLSIEAFDYYKLLKDQSDNSALSPRIQPSILRGNLRNLTDTTELVLGYFGVSEVQYVEMDN